MTDEELKKWCRSNWNRIADDVREKCLAHLEAKLNESGAMAALKSFKQDGFPLGFHFSGGMWVRNVLREVLLDKDLPPIKQPHDELFARNWDDFYTGALDELLERHQ